MGRFQLELIYILCIYYVLYIHYILYIHIIDGTTVENKGKLILTFMIIALIQSND